MRQRRGRRADAPDHPAKPPTPAKPPAQAPAPEKPPAAAPSKSVMARVSRARWIVLALASGSCAAVNGAFAKLTTTELTTSLSRHLAALLGLASAERAVDVAVRAAFFVLNLSFNAVMWTLFTAALAAGSSATQVSIINTSSNFVLTALLGLVVFAEALPPLWWAGAALLVAGNVIVGRSHEADAENAADGPEDAESAPLLRDRLIQDEIAALKAALQEAEAEPDDVDDEDVPQLGDLSSDSSAS